MLPKTSPKLNPKTISLTTEVLLATPVFVNICAALITSFPAIVYYRASLSQESVKML